MQDPNAKLLVNIIYSTNNGDSFTTSSSLVDKSANGDDLIPNFAVDPITGDVAVAFYGTSSPDDPSTDFYTMTSSDGGNTFSRRVKVSIDSTDLTGQNNNQYGDYSSVSFYNGEIYPAWTDGSSLLEGNPNPPSADFAVARVDLVHVGDQPPIVTAQPISTTEGTSFTKTVATFTDLQASLTSSDFKATINWGDGTADDTNTSITASGPRIVTSPSPAAIRM